MKEIFLALLLVFMLKDSVYAQNISSKKEITTLIDTLKVDSSFLVTKSVLNKIITDNMFAISGSNLKDGKSSNTSATIDDKSATIIFSIKAAKEHMFFIQPTVSASSTSGFADVLSKGLYQRTLSGGVNFQYFLGNALIAFDSSYRIKLHNEMRIKKRWYDSEEKARDSINILQTIDSAKKIYLRLTSFIQNIDIGNPLYKFSMDSLKQLKKLDSYFRLLVKYGVLSDGDLHSKYSDINNNLCSANLATTINDALDRNYITYQDSLQLNSATAKTIRWLSGGIQYNNQPEPVLENDASSKPTTYYNEYITAKFSVNYLRLRINNDKIYVSPNFNYSTIRNFNDDDKITINFTSTISVAGSQAQRIDSSISYFSTIPKRSHAWYFELPFVYFCTQKNIGIDLAFRMGGNNPLGDNVGGRFGIYLPVGKKDNNTLLIEPLLKFDNLFSSAKNNFIKDNIGFGFNLSVSLPAFLQ